MIATVFEGRGYRRLWPAREAIERLLDRARPTRHAPIQGAPVTVVSPHLDDAVFSCGQLIAASCDATVVTVFSAESSDGRLTPWDEACGYRAGDDVMAARAAEDDAALAALRARPVRLGLTESSYAGEIDEQAVEAALTAAILARRGTTIVVPVGVHHHDHVAVANIAARVAREHPGLDWWAYADLPYAERYPEAVDARLEELGATQRVRPVMASVRQKRAAIRHYRSQLRVLRRDVPLMLVEERYWQLAPSGAPSTHTTRCCSSS